MTASVRVRAPAKVNLFLRILGRRPDGFHEIETLFQAVDLADEVTVVRGRPGVRLEVDGPDLGPVEQNLAHRAARLYLEGAGVAATDGVTVRLRKRIPAGAGLGGGSSDAAAVLRCMDVLWAGALAPPDLALAAASLGSDVPFFLGAAGALALGRGRGEILRALPPLPEARLVLVLPPVHVATGPAYGALAARRVVEPPNPREPWDPARLALGWAGVAQDAENDFEAVVPPLHPPVASSLRALRAAGAAPALLSGSGAACFGVFPGPDAAAAAAGDLSRALGWSAVEVRTLPGLPEVEAVPADGGASRGG